MWKRSGLKQRARQLLKAQYWRLVAVCFIMAILTGVYSDTLNVLFSYDSAREIHSANILMNSSEGISNSEIVNEFLTGIGVDQQKEQEHRYGTEGVLAAIFNSTTQSGSILFGILNSLNQVLFHDRIMASVIIMIGAMLLVLYSLFVENMLIVSECRFFLEANTYPKTPIQRLLFLIRIRKIWNVDKVMLFKTLFTFLWDLTLVGGIIKRYSYRMIPYILAENPAIGRKEAFALSKRMMHGNKWRTFLLDASFLGWWVLNLITFGLLKIFYMNAYKTATTAQLYLTLRQQAVEQKYEYYECLNDPYLIRQPDLPNGQPLDEYPMNLFPIPEYARRQWLRIDYMRHYTLRSLILLFFTFSILGWVWEVLLNLVNGLGLVNRGVLHGPWLPIYGAGGAAVLIILKKIREKPILTFFLTVVICGVMEYLTSFVLELMTGTRWWDYSGFLFNLNGRICLEGLIVFGLGGCAFIYVLAPMLDEFYQKIPKRVQTLVCVILLVFFAGDLGLSYLHPNTGKGISDYPTRPPVVKQERLPKPHK